MPPHEQEPKPSILIVEDEPAIAAGLARTLNQAGMKSLTCGKIAEAVGKLGNQRFDVVVLDLVLGRDQGERLLEILRRDRAGINRTTPVLIMSGHLDAEVIRRLQPDVSGFIVKPFEHRTFVETVQRILAVSGVKAPRSAPRAPVPAR